MAPVRIAAVLLVIGGFLCSCGVCAGPATGSIGLFFEDDGLTFATVAGVNNTIALSRDGGSTWARLQMDLPLEEPIVGAGILADVDRCLLVSASAVYEADGCDAFRRKPATPWRAIFALNSSYSLSSALRLSSKRLVLVVTNFLTLQQEIWSSDGSLGDLRLRQRLPPVLLIPQLFALRTAETIGEHLETSPAVYGVASSWQSSYLFYGESLLVLSEDGAIFDLRRFPSDTFAVCPQFPERKVFCPVVSVAVDPVSSALMAACWMEEPHCSSRLFLFRDFFRRNDSSFLDVTPVSFTRDRHIDDILLFVTFDMSSRTFFTVSTAINMTIVTPVGNSVWKTASGADFASWEILQANLVLPCDPGERCPFTGEETALLAGSGGRLLVGGKRSSIVVVATSPSLPSPDQASQTTGGSLRREYLQETR